MRELVPRPAPPHTVMPPILTEDIVPASAPAACSQPDEQEKEEAVAASSTEPTKNVTAEKETEEISVEII